MSTIDPIETARELATHASNIQHLQEDMDKMVAEMAEIKITLQNIEKTLSEAIGGWKSLLASGGGVSFLSGFIGVAIGFWGHK